MNGLPSDTDLSGFVGAELQVIYLGKWQVSLIFSTLADCSVTIEGDYSVAINGQYAVRFDSSVRGASHIGELLTKTVAGAGVVDNALRLAFDDGSVIEIYDSQSTYESYQFTVAGSTYVV